MQQQESGLRVGGQRPGFAGGSPHASQRQRSVKLPRAQQLFRLVLQGNRPVQPHLSNHNLSTIYVKQGAPPRSWWVAGLPSAAAAAAKPLASGIVGRLVPPMKPPLLLRV